MRRKTGTPLAWLSARNRSPSATIASESPLSPLAGVALHHAGDCTWPGWRQACGCEGLGGGMTRAAGMRVTHSLSAFTGPTPGRDSRKSQPASTPPWTKRRVASSAPVPQVEVIHCAHEKRIHSVYLRPEAERSGIRSCSRPRSAFPGSDPAEGGRAWSLCKIPRGRTSSGQAEST